MARGARDGWRVTDERNSLAPGDIEALAKLARSPMVKPLVGPLLAMLGIVASSVLGWVGAKVDVKSDVSALSGKVDTLSGKVENVSSAVNDVRKIVEGIDRESPSPKERGKLQDLEDQMTVIGEQIAYARGAALAAETEPRYGRKCRAGDAWTKAYTNLINHGQATPAGALISLFDKTAVPNE